MQVKTSTFLNLYKKNNRYLYLLFSLLKMPKVCIFLERRFVRNPPFLNSRAHVGIFFRFALFTRADKVCRQIFTYHLLITLRINGLG